MPTGPHFNETVLSARERLAAGRTRIQRQHDSGSPGIQVCASLTDLLDMVVLDIFESAVTAVEQSTGSLNLRGNVALVPHGGYGRRDVAPFSDVDLMLLHAPSASLPISDLAKRLVMDLNDTGLDLGFSVRTPNQACRLGKRDPVIFTSQAEARYLVGSVRLYSQFMKRFRRMTQRRRRTLIPEIIKARLDERAQYGETVFLLEPNLKRTRGGLRDIHLVRWLGFARYGETDPNSLQLISALSEEDTRKLRKATEFLLRLRNEMHFFSGKPYDVLHRGEQVRVAELWGYAGSEEKLPVERFMRDYFTHTTNVRNISSNFRATARPVSGIATWASPLITHNAEGDYRVGPVHITTTRRGTHKLLQGDLVEVLRIMDLASCYDKRIHPQVWGAIRDDMISRHDVEVTDGAAQRFMSLLSQMPQLGEFLRKLHELRVLEKLVAGMEHARSLLQFNRYHKYTVDEHCIRAVQRATEFQVDEGNVGRIYRKIKNRALLHLALLIHDLGKGFTEDHSIVGAQLAEKTGKRLKLKERDTELLVFLVQQHLLMAHLAFRRDTNAESVIVEFASDVGSVERLRMLYVLTCADFAAVGPGVLNPWKVDVLTQLYDRTRSHLSETSPRMEREVDLKRQEFLKTLPVDDTPWYQRQIEALPPAYVLGSDRQAMIQDLGRMRKIPEDDAVAWARYSEQQRATEFSIGAREDLVPGIFHRLTGVLTSLRLQILAAEIHSLSDGLLLDRFYVHDGDFSGQPPQARNDEVCQALVESLRSPADSSPNFRQTFGNSQTKPLPGLEFLPTRITIDTDSSPQYTIIDVFAHDRLGLLYTIARRLFELRISVRMAKIATYLDQVVDVFFVTDEAGSKIDDEQFLQNAQRELLEAIENYS